MSTGDASRALDVIEEDLALHEDERRRRREALVPHVIAAAEAEIARAAGQAAAALGCTAEEARAAAPRVTIGWVGAAPPGPDHVAGQRWTREQIERLAGPGAKAERAFAALLGHISRRYRRTEDPARLGRVRWLINIEAAVAMRDTARPEARPVWEDFVQRLMAVEPPPVPGTTEPDYSAWMPRPAGAGDAAPGPGER